MSLLPPSKPNAKNFRSLADNTVHCNDAVYLVGVRGYYAESMGPSKTNDVGLYDDAVGILTETSTMTFNFNVDPGAHRRGMANLMEGQWLYKIGIHGLSKPKSQQYQAYVQASDVSVMRDGVGKDTGRFGINIHRGGETKVSSLGCQTVPPAQWDAFNETVKRLMKEAGQTTIKYFLIRAPNA